MSVKLFIMSIFSSLASLFSCQPSSGGFVTLDVAEFEAFIAPDSVQRVDVRTLAEYSEGHIPNALHINVNDESFSEMAAQLLRKDKPVAVYCRSGRRSTTAAEILTRMGYEVTELKGGFIAWTENGKPVEK